MQKVNVGSRHGVHLWVLTAYCFRLRNDLYCVEWGVKLYSLTHYCLLYRPTTSCDVTLFTSRPSLARGRGDRQISWPRVKRYFPAITHQPTFVLRMPDRCRRHTST